MKTKLFLLLLVVVLSFTACSFPTPSTTEQTPRPVLDASHFADSLEQSLENSEADKSFSYAADWLEYYGLSGYYIYYKLIAVEDLYDAYFIRQVPQAKEVGRSIVEWVIKGLRQEALDPQNQTAFTDFIISAYVVSVGDKYGTYLTKEDYQSFKSQTTGSFVGIGVYTLYDLTQNTLLVQSVLAGSPAEDAGVQSGDYITHIDGASVEEMGYYLCLERIRGEEGSTVVLTILRGEESFDVAVIRAALTENTVFAHTIGEGKSKLGYLLITSFSEITASQFKAAVDELVDKDVQGMIFDLRYNGGGTLSTVLSMLDYLLPDGERLINCSYYDGSTQHRSGDDGHQVDLPFAVITNGYSASASEIFAAALRDYANHGLISQCQIVGETTYGKGTMQTLFEFTDETAITVSIAYFRPPFSESYEGIGVIPDITVALPEEHQGRNPQNIPEEEDTQLQVAIDTFGQK